MRERETCIVINALLLQVKKDYLEGGAMADTADLIVLGAYYGTGNKGSKIVASNLKVSNTVLKICLLFICTDSQ